VQKTRTSKSETIAILAVFLVFLCVNFLFYNLSTQNAHLASDSSSYLTPAKLLVEDGVYRSQMRLPIYPVFLSFFVRFSDRPQPYVVSVQVLMLFCTAIAAMKISKYLLPKFSLLVLILTAFNSNAVLHAHKILPDTLFSLLFMLFILLLVQSYHSRSLPRAALCGIVAGLTALTRGNGAYLIILMPLVMLLGWRIVNKSLGIECSRSCAISVLAAVVVITPWLLHNHSQKGVLKINSAEYVNYAVHDNLMRIEYLGSGLSRRDAENAVREKALQKAGIDPSTWENKSAEQTHRLVKAHSFAILRDYPPKVLVGAGLRSLGYFFLDPGYKDFTGHLDIESLRLSEDKLASNLTIGDFFRKLFFDSEPVVRVYAAFFVVLLILRLFALVGLYGAIADRNSQILLICGGFIIYFAFVSGMIGYARYRLGADPLLFMLAVYGLVILTGILKRRFGRTGG
jgi:4-amino-4-deoxy-L-arabinose transferase-like glycosyltransferase